MESMGEDGVLKYPADWWVTLMRVLCGFVAVVGVGFPVLIANSGGGTGVELVLVPVCCLVLFVMSGWLSPAQTVATRSDLVVRYALRRPCSVPLASLRSFHSSLWGDFLVTDSGRRVQIFHTGADEFVRRLAERLADLVV